MPRKIRQLKAGDLIPEGEPKKYKNQKGYIRLRWKVGINQYVEVYEHRVFDGRVTAHQHVHHKDGNPSNNSSENLTPLNTSDHRKEHRKIDYDAVTLLYNKGLSTPEISLITGWDASSIWRAIDKSGIPKRKYIAHNKVVDLPKEKIIDLHNKGYSAQTIAKECGTTKGVILLRIKEWGLNPHPVGRRPRKLEHIKTD